MLTSTRGALVPRKLLTGHSATTKERSSSGLSSCRLPRRYISAFTSPAVIDVIPDDVGFAVLLDGDLRDRLVTFARCFVRGVREEHWYGPVRCVVVRDCLAGFGHAVLDRVLLQQHFIKLFGEFSRYVIPHRCRHGDDRRNAYHEACLRSSLRRFGW